MRRSELVAIVTTVGLLLIAAVLITGAIYSTTASGVASFNVALWAGGLACVGQALVAGLAAWGLRLTRQNYDLTSVPVIGETTKDESGKSSLAGFRMSYADDTHEARQKRRGATPVPDVAAEVDVRTLETGFQRVVVALTAAALLALGGVIVYLTLKPFYVYWFDPSKGFPLPRIDPMIVTIAGGALAAYVALLYYSRVRREMQGFGEAINGLLTLGLPGIVAVAVSVFLAWSGMSYAAEIAAGIVVFLVAVQGLELTVNAMRSYAGVEEFDQEPVDLQTTPLVPMLSSVWINGIRMLAGQSLGFSGAGERGVIARMMPRVLVAAAVLGVLVSMIRVVPAGQVAVLERWGRVQGYDEGPEGINAHVLKPGLYITMPWPIDELVYIPTQSVQQLTVGAEIEAPPELGKVDFSFWSFRHVKEDVEGEFITGDTDKSTVADVKAGEPTSQLLESYAGVWWKVKNPGKFYQALSHSEHFVREGGNVHTRPIYEAIVINAASHAMTKAFAIHTAEQVMISDRKEVEQHAHRLMQERLDALDCGIEVVEFTIKDVHPPYGNPDDQQKIKGPAGAYEDVVAAHEDQVLKKLVAEREASKTVSQSKAEANGIVFEAEAYQSTRVSGAMADSEQVRYTVEAFREFPFTTQARMTYARLGESLAQVQKVLVGPNVKPPVVWQESRETPGMPRMGPGPGN